MDLSKKKCVACEGWMKPMPGFLVKKYLKQVKKWKVNNKGRLYKEFNRKTAVSFENWHC